MPAQKKYKAINAEMSISFFHRTKVEPTEDTSVIPRYKFHLTSFDDATTLLWDLNHFLGNKPHILMHQINIL